jgi:hypothetical protein
LSPTERDSARYNEIAQPVEWKSTRADLEPLADREAAQPALAA